MKTTKYYKVAENVFSVTADEKIFLAAENYKPFLTEKAETVFVVEIVEEKFDGNFTEEIVQDDEGQKIVIGHNETHKIFGFYLLEVECGVLVSDSDYKNARLFITGYESKFAFDNAAMILYALSTASKSTLLFHSSVTVLDGFAYMFLGKSGTGKSTHSSLWLKNFPEARLLNDDNPVVRICEDKTIKVYGSPWSGKTPCYKNKVFPIGGIVSLSQAKFNKISELKGVMAYVAIVTSISGNRWERHIADALHESENFLTQHVKVWHLECLPDDAAAILCKETITKQ
jgi:hypothetical protein